MRGQPAPLPRGQFFKQRPKRHSGICHASGKRIFRTRKKAIKAPAPIGQPHRIYECRACGFWHTSTQEKHEKPRTLRPDHAPQSAQSQRYG